MSSGCELLAPRADDIVKMLVAQAHHGAHNLDLQMGSYIYKRRAADGTYIINLKWTWEKLLAAARAIVAIDNPADVIAISCDKTGQRAVLKFSKYTGCNSIAGRFTPGTFTNHTQKNFKEPRLLIVTDPRKDHQAIREASFVNIPVIAFCNTDSPLRCVDLAIPCNNSSVHCIGLMWWLLARQVLQFRGVLPRVGQWDVMVDLFFYRDPTEAEKEEQLAKQQAAQLQQQPLPDLPPETLDSGHDLALPAAGEVAHWAEEQAAAPGEPINAPRPAPAAPGYEHPAPDWSVAGAWADQPDESAGWGGPRPGGTW